MALYRNAFYWFCLLLAVSVLGFWRSYFSQLGTGNIHVTHHAHGITMLLWVAMLVTQSWLIRQRKNPMHRTLGKVSFVLAPLIVLTAIWVNIHFMTRNAEMEPPYPSDLIGIYWFGYFLAGAFAILYAMAIVHRRRVQLHARYMVGTSLIFIVPGLGRALSNYLTPLVGWAPTFFQVMLVPFAIGLWLLFLDWRNEKPIRPYLVFSGLWALNLVMWFAAARFQIWHDFAEWAAKSGI